MFKHFKLWRGQNNLARVICQSRGHADARSLLHSLHWLPVRQRVTCKVTLLTHKVQTTATLTYLSEPVQTHASPRVLRSSDAPTLIVPRIHTELARRAFSVAAPSTWNSTCSHSTVRKHSHFRMPLKNPSVQTHLVLLCWHKHLRIFGPKGTIQMRYCYYYYNKSQDYFTSLIYVTRLES